MFLHYYQGSVVYIVVVYLLYKLKYELLSVKGLKALKYNHWMCVGDGNIFIELRIVILWKCEKYISRSCKFVKFIPIFM
jgi:hypothetical protein